MRSSAPTAHRFRKAVVETLVDDDERHPARLDENERATRRNLHTPVVFDPVEGRLCGRRRLHFEHIRKLERVAVQPALLLANQG